MKSIWSFVAGVSVACAIAIAVGKRAAHRISEFTLVNLNTCSSASLRALGLSDEEANAIIEGRPYRNKLDLVSQMIIPEASYEAIRNRISVEEGAASEGVKVAS